MSRLAILFSWTMALALVVSVASQRIVSTAPSFTEILYALGLGDRVAGVTIYCRYPEEALGKPKVGTYEQPDVESVLALRPDLVITQQSPVSVAGQLRALRLNVLDVELDGLESIYRAIAQVGQAAGVGAKGKALVSSLRGQLAAVRRRTDGMPRRRVMFVVGRTPGAISELIVVGRSSYLNELFEIAGGDNIFRSSIAAYPKVSMEEVMGRNPEVIVDMGEMAQTVGVTDAQKKAVVTLWKQYPMLEAVKRGRVFAVASDIYVVPGPRVAEAAREFARMFYSETNP